LNRQATAKKKQRIVEESDTVKDLLWKYENEVQTITESHGVNVHIGKKRNKYNNNSNNKSR
jgi:hypothetical protein